MTAAGARRLAAMVTLCLSLGAGARRLAAIITLSVGLGTAQSPVEISLPSLSFPSAAGMLPLPLTLNNRGTAISGIGFSVRISGLDLQLDTILTSARTDGWLIQSTPSVSMGDFAFIMYDPAGRDLKAGSGPVALLVLRAPLGRDYAGHGSILVQVESVSDRAGRELTASSTGAHITVGPVAHVAISSAQGDVGDTVIVDLTIDSPTPLGQATIDISVDPQILMLVNATAAPGATVELVPDSGSAESLPYRLFLTPDSLGESGGAYSVSLGWAIEARASGQVVKLSVGEVIFADQAGRSIVAGSKTAGYVSIYPGHLPAPAGVAINYTARGDLLIGWTAHGRNPAQAELTGFTVYRRNADGPSAKLLTVPASAGTSAYRATDSSAVAGQRYLYNVVAVYDSQHVSEHGDWISAQYLPPVEVRLKETPWHAGDPFKLPIALTNDLPISSFDFVVRGLGAMATSTLAATLNRRVPPGWTIKLDSLGLGALRVSGQAAASQYIAQGTGRIVTLTLSSSMESRLVGPLEVANITMLDDMGESLPAVGIGGAITPWRPPVATVRIGSGLPVPPGANGEVTLYLENDRPMTALQMTLSVTGQGVALTGAAPAGRLPSESIINWQQTGERLWSLIVSSSTNAVTLPGNGPLMTLTLRVDKSAQPGDRSIELTGLGLSDAIGTAHHLPVARGDISVGSVEVVIGGAELSVEPSRLVTVPLLMTTARPLCSLTLEIDYADDFLELLRVQNGDGAAEAVINYSAADGAIILEVKNLMPPGQPGDNAPARVVAADLIFSQKSAVTHDTSLLLTANKVQAVDCQGLPVYAQGIATLVHLRPSKRGLRHYTLPPSAGGRTHFITVREATVGGAFLQASDELAVLRIPTDDGAHVLAGAGLVQQDGSVTIMARPGNLSLAAGQTSDGKMLFRAWSHLSGRESLPSSAAEFVLGRGIWGENQGVTIIARLRLQNRPAPVAVKLPRDVVLEQNRPNPFRDSTTVQFGLPTESEVVLSVHNLLGRQVAVLHDGLTGAGYHTVVWDGRSMDGRKVASSMLFLQLRTGGRTLTRKLILMP